MNKTNAILKSVFTGLIFGGLLFFMPFFLLMTLFFLMLISFGMKMFWWRNMRYSGHFHYQFAEKVRNMSAEEYARFKSVQYAHCKKYDDYTEVKEDEKSKNTNPDNQ